MPNLISILLFFFLFHSKIFSESCLSGDCINGKGTKIFANGDKYEGDFKKGKLDGIGILTSTKQNTNGDIIFSKIYEGDWKNNKKEGRGKLVIQKGQKIKKYSGEFKNGKLNGQGSFETDSATYQGRFINNKLEGQGIYTNKNGEKYLGEFLNQKFDGKGTYTFKDGSIYIGDFKAGKFHGKGRLFNNKHKLIKSGKWEKGEFK